MKWFYNLNKTVRFLFAVIPAFISVVCFAIEQLIPGAILLVIAIIFFVLAYNAEKKEKEKAKEQKHPATTTAETKRVTPTIQDSQIDARLVELDAEINKYESLIENTDKNDKDKLKSLMQAQLTLIEGKRELIKRKMGNFQSESLNVDISIQSNDIYFPLHTKARGVTFEGRQKFLAESQAGDPLSIKHCPSDDYPETIYIFNNRTNANLGTIEKDLATRLINSFGSGCSFNGIINEITGGTDGKNYGCDIIIKNLMENI